MHVIIIGAGLSGLLLAHGLKKNGISFSIYEAEDANALNRRREWGMSIQWALPMLSDLLPPHILNRLQEASVDPHYIFPDSGNSMPVYDASTGECVKDIPLVKMLRVSRSKFRTLLSEDIDVQYGKEFRTLRTLESEDTTTVTFLDGTTATGTLIIGADGANSALRTAIFPGNEGHAQHIPYTGINMHVRYSDASLARQIRQSLNPILAIGIHPKGYWLWLSIQDVPDPERPETWTFQLQWTWRSEVSDADADPMWPTATLDLDSLRREADAVFAEPFRSAWTGIPDGTLVYGNRISMWEPRAVPRGSVFAGKVALVGDAGHAMTFHRGQGLNHGIADAVELSGLLVGSAIAGRDLRDAVGEYERGMIRRAGEEVGVSKTNTEMVHDWERVRSSPLMQRGGDRIK